MTTTTPHGPPPAFDPEVAAALEALMAQYGPSEDRPAVLSTTSFDHIAVVRKAIQHVVPSDEELRRDGLIELEDRAVSDDVSVLVARPAGLRTPKAGIYFLHGGGMIMGNNRFGLPEILDWAVELDLVVISVEYRLAPEHQHPVPVEDCYSGLLWTIEHATELGFAPERLVIAGSSAGGGLAAATTQLARDRGGPMPAGQLLMAPMLDDRNATPSAHQMAGLGVWDRESNELGWSALLGEQRGDADVSPYAAAARAADLSGLPPAFIDVGSAETFRDEDVDYASRIWRAGGSAELHVWPGGFHGFEGIAPLAAISRSARSQRVQWLRRILQL
ncbi:alpha/beta hydrolase [Streptomyces sp. GTA36]